MLIESKIRKVTVFKDRAMVERMGKVHLNSGEHTIIFENIPIGAISDSIQLSSGNECLLLDIKTKEIHLENSTDEEKKDLMQEISELDALIEETQDKLNNLQEEKSLLQKLANISSESPKKAIIPLLVPDKIEEMLQFYLTKLNEIDDADRLAKRDLAKMEERMQILKEQKKTFNKGNLKKAKQVFVKLFVKNESDIILMINYLIMNASWRPIYDFRLNSDEKKLSIAYNALISQNTGEKWENVNLSLSTARPQVSAIPPILNPWYINVYEYQPPSPKMTKSYRASAGINKEEGFEAELNKISDDFSAAPLPIVDAKLETATTSFSFSIPGNQTIMDNGEEHKIAITIINVETNMEYNSVPKLSPYAYLTTDSVNQSEFPLLAGDAKIFLDNSYVSDSSIKLVAPNQNFKTFLGIDEGLEVVYKLLNRFTKDEGLFSKKNRILFEYSIAITNHKKINCEIKISDQIPVSQNHEIKVELIEPKIKENSQELSKSADGMIDWLFTIKPGEKIQYFLKYSVEYQKDIEISGMD